MSSSLRSFALSILLSLAIVPAALAANGRESRPRDLQLTVGASKAVAAPVLSSEQSVLTMPVQLEPVRLTRVPTYAASTAALLAAESQPIGFQNRVDTSNRHVRWAIYGAAIGLAVGLIDGHDELSDTLIGAGIGLGLSFVVRR
jgi:hypothetical protein